MGRIKQFDRHAALDEAMTLFWTRGYHATSIQDLVDHLGVNRQSLYDTFGGKSDLFRAALERYRELQALPMRRSLERDGPLGDVLREFFGTMIAELLKDGGKGCLISNTTTELAAQDESIFRLCSANARQLEAAFSGLLARAQDKGEIPTTRSPVQLARFLASTMSGLGVTAKATRDPKVLKDVVDVALSAIGL
jgi:TetR/AcrR family transcriptional regulator, transcriptional repressor for nem operon